MNIFKIIKLGFTVNRVVEAIQSERRGETNFKEMSFDISEALADQLSEEVNIVDENLRGLNVNEKLDLLKRDLLTSPTIGKQVRVDLLKKKLQG